MIYSIQWYIINCSCSCSFVIILNTLFLHMSYVLTEWYKCTDTKYLDTKLLYMVHSVLSFFFLKIIFLYHSIQQVSVISIWCLLFFSSMDILPSWLLCYIFHCILLQIILRHQINGQRFNHHYYTCNISIISLVMSVSLQW